MDFAMLIGTTGICQGRAIGPEARGLTPLGRQKPHFANSGGILLFPNCQAPSLVRLEFTFGSLHFLSPNVPLFPTSHTLSITKQKLLNIFGFHMLKETLQHLSFCVWLISLNMMFFHSIHNVASYKP